MMEVMTGMDSDERLWEARLGADVRAGGGGAGEGGGAIVLLASVYARDPGRRSGLTAGETYTDWPIVLERRGSGWHVVSSGY